MRLTILSPRLCICLRFEITLFIDILLVDVQVSRRHVTRLRVDRYRIKLDAYHDAKNCTPCSAYRIDGTCLIITLAAIMWKKENSGLRELFFLNESLIDRQRGTTIYNGEGRNYPGFKLIHRKIIRVCLFPTRRLPRMRIDDMNFTVTRQTFLVIVIPCHKNRFRGLELQLFFFFFYFSSFSSFRNSNSFLPANVYGNSTRVRSYFTSLYFRGTAIIAHLGGY